MSTDADPKDVLAAAWHAVLGDPPSPTADFYALGGDSSTAIRIATMVGDSLANIPDVDAFVMTELLDQGTYPQVETALLEYVADNEGG
ncbi:MAG: acyl carrier protein [Actinocatenispora sp.]